MGPKPFCGVGHHRILGLLKSLEEEKRLSLRALLTCRKIAGKSWGTSPRIISWLYLMVVRPILTYGVIAWGDRARLSTTKVKLHKLQRMASICMKGAMRTCPTAALEVLMEVTPLHIVIEMKRKATLIRIE